MSPLPPLRIGPSGWAYPHWNDVVYPRPAPRGFNELEYLARYVDLVEINTSFYGFVKPEIARLWARRVSGNADFRFSMKLNRRFTHDRSLEAHDVDAFRRGARALLDAGRLGCVLMQFPWSFRLTAENREFLIRLRRTFHEFPLVGEMRHASWMRDEGIGVFIDYHIGWANIDQPQFTKAMPPTAFLTSPVGYVRLHGRSHPEWFREFGAPAGAVRRHDYMYSPAELAEWAARIDRIRVPAREVYVAFNNDAGGRALVNALAMQALFEPERRLAPPSLKRRFRQELEGFRGREPWQESLFGIPAPAARRAVA